MSVAAPLFKIKSSGANFDWTDDCQQSFEVLKHKLTAAPGMAFPMFEKDFVFVTDASEVGLGAVLSQKFCGEEHMQVECYTGLRRTTAQQKRKHWL